jgi:hypothetical protein
METHSESRRTGEKGEDFGEQENGRERSVYLCLDRVLTGLVPFKCTEWQTSRTDGCYNSIFAKAGCGLVNLRSYRLGAGADPKSSVWRGHTHMRGRTFSSIQIRSCFSSRHRRRRIRSPVKLTTAGTPALSRPWTLEDGVRPCGRCCSSASSIKQADELSNEVEPDGGMQCVCIREGWVRELFCWVATWELGFLHMICIVYICMCLIRLLRYPTRTVLHVTTSEAPACCPAPSLTTW